MLRQITTRLFPLLNDLCTHKGPRWLCYPASPPQQWHPTSPCRSAAVPNLSGVWWTTIAAGFEEFKSWLFIPNACRRQRQSRTLLARRIWNMRGRPCVTSSSVYSSSSMQLNSFRRPWIRGRRCWQKHVRRDSSQVCKVQGTPGKRHHT